MSFSPEGYSRQAKTLRRTHFVQSSMVARNTTWVLKLAPYTGTESGSDTDTVLPYSIPIYFVPKNQVEDRIRQVFTRIGSLEAESNYSNPRTGD